MAEGKKSYIFFFLKKILPYWPYSLTAFISDGFITLIGMVPPLLMVLVFDYAYPYGDLNVFSAVVLLTFAIYLIDFIFSAHIDFLNIYVHQKLEYDLTLNLFQKIERLPILGLERIKIGDLTVRLTSDVSNIIRLIVNIYTDIAMNLIKLAVFLYISFSFDYKVTWMALLSVPLYLIETKFFTKKSEGIQQDMQSAESDVFDGIQSKLVNIRTIKAFNQQRKEAEELGIRLRKTFILSIKESIVSITAVFTNSFTIKIWGSFIGWYLGYEVINGRLTIGEVVALGVYVPLLEQPIRGLAEVYNEVRMASVSTRRVATILHSKEEEPLAKNRPLLNVARGHIEFKNVSFFFKGDVPAISNFSLDIPAYSSIAFVGESGSGKSTLLNLLMRFYDCQKGGIFIDGQNISSVDISSLRRSLGTVFQETTIVPGTIKDNILYGAENRTKEDVVRAATEAGIHEFIESLPKGYDTELSFPMRGLSGGQQQRLAIARVLLRDPKILILDEPTSALDAASEFVINNAIHRCIGNRTVIIIAHRLSIVRRVDKIVMLSKGKIVEEGTFDELLKKQGRFFSLYNLQFGGFQKFVDTFDAELQRVQRYKEHLTLVMLENREFEELIKDAHPNVAMKYMEEIDLFIKKHIRVMDFSATYFGNKIVIALPETNSHDAKNMLKRLRSAFKGFRERATFRAAIVSCKEVHAKQSEEMFEMAGEILARMPLDMETAALSDVE